MTIAIVDAEYVKRLVVQRFGLVEGGLLAVYIGYGFNILSNGWMIRP